MFVVDGCASTEKDLNKHVRAIRQHAKVWLNKDLWHKAKNIGKAWFRLVNRKASYGKALYPNLCCVHLKPLKTHWTFCAKKCEGNVDEFDNLWKDRVYHWNIDLELPEDGEEYQALLEFMSILQGTCGTSAEYTSNTESFHSVANKYCSKGLWRSFDM